MRRTLLTFAILVLGFIPGREISGQVLRGKAVEEETGQPLAGAFILLLDEDGARRSAVLTDEAGNFIIRAPGAGRYTLVMERIGFRNTTSPVLELGPFQTLFHDFSAPVQPISLEGITASGTGRCYAQGEIGAEVSRLWEEARKALSISEWVRADRSVAYQWARFERVRGLVSLDIGSQTAQLQSGIGANPFKSSSAKDLAERGYVRSLSGDEYAYFGLDAPTLLSEEFLETHCFRVHAPDRHEPGLIGLEFEPVPTHHLPDITGVLWIDQATSEVRFLEFNYTRHMLPIDLSVESFGGRVEFRRLANGAWIVSQWWLRMPQVVSRVIHEPGGRVLRPTDTARDRLIRALRGGVQILEQGGEVRFIAQPGPNANGRASVEGVIHDLKRGEPLVGATVFLTGSPRSARTDSEGWFQLNNVPDGVNEIAFIHPAADSLGLLVSPQPISLNPGETMWVELSIPDGVGCSDPFKDSDRGGITGVVYHAATGDPVPGALVNAEWFGGEAGRGGQGGEGGNTSVRTDDDGRFLFCSVPVGRVHLVLAPNVGRAAVALQLDGMGIIQKDLVIHQAP